MARKRRITSTPVPSPETPAGSSTGRNRARKGATASQSAQGQGLDAVASAQVVAPGSGAPAAPRTPRKRTARAAKSPGLNPTQEAVQSTGDKEVSERERIALLAYSMWEARGRQGGSPEEDWFRAEEEIRTYRSV